MDAYDHMLTLPYEYFQKNHTGSIVSRLINDTEYFFHLFGSRFRRFFAPILVAAVTGVGLVLIDWKLGCALIVINVISMLINILFSGPVRRLSDSILNNLSVLTEKVFNLFSGFLVIRIFNIQKTVRDEYKKANHSVVSDSRKRMYLEEGLDSVNYALRYS